MRRRLQESFHLSPAAASSAGGFFSALSQHQHHHGLSSQIPTISVSVQTEPSMVTMNGTTTSTNLANTSSLMNNGGLFQNGVSSNPNPVVAESNAPRSYGTLPHPHHHLQNIHVSKGSTKRVPTVSSTCYF